MTGPGGSRKLQATGDPAKIKADTVREALRQMMLVGTAAHSVTATTVPWTGVTGTPTTLAGYGITDAYTKTASDARYAPIGGPFPWADVTGTPTTLAGYGITSPLDVAEGGTGIASYTAGDLLTATGGTTLTKLGIGAANTVLTSSGSAPQWSANIAYAALPTGNGTWDTGAGTTMTLVQALTVSNAVLVNADALNQWDNTGNGRILQTTTGAASSGAHYRLRSARGTIASPAALALNDELGRYAFAGYNGTAYVESALIFTLATDPLGYGVGKTGSQMLFRTTPNGSSTTANALTLGSDQSATFAGAAVFNAGLTVIAGSIRIVSGTLGVLATPVSNIGVSFGSTLTASSGTALGINIASAFAAAANGDTLRGMSIQPTFIPGAFTGLSTILLNLQAFSVAGFTSPADPIMLNIGTLTGTGATNAYAIRLGIPTGATNNYFIAATTVSLFNVTAAGALTLASSATIGTGFGCNGKAAQTAFASGGAAPAGGTGTAAGGWDTAAHRDAAITLLNNIRSALVANGILS